MSSVNVRNCIRFYQTAEELDASTLMNYCGEIIASHWVSRLDLASAWSRTKYQGSRVCHLLGFKAWILLGLGYKRG